ncbi:MAG: DUF4231 domain-containing protein [Burkholderiales bacterium]|nr:DUF4231 domain-containing protein [Burkholderiales bacterium]
MKRTYERTRWLTFGTSIAGALLAALASQATSDDWRAWLAIVGAVVLAFGGLLTARFLGPDRASRWARARVASEALKRAAFEFSVQASPFDDHVSRKAKLQERVGAIEKEVDDLLSEVVAATPGSTPRTPWSPDDYVSGRVEKSADWYERAASESQRAARSLRRVELAMAVVTTVLTATIGAVSKEWLVAHLAGFDWAALVAVLTTISGTVLAHIEASRYDYLVSSYRAAARQLRLFTLSKPQQVAAPSSDWSDFVASCEGVIASETGSWVARFGRAAQ